MRKFILVFFASIFVSGCSQYSAMLGPSITLVETGSVLQATTSYGSSRGFNIIMKISSITTKGILSWYCITMTKW